MFNLIHKTMKIKLLPLPITLALLMLAGCSDKGQAVAERVQQMAETAELGTVEYTVKKVVKTNDKQRFTIGDRQILFQSTAYLKAGVKLDGFTADRVQVSGNDVTLTLPHAELLSFNMPAEETRTVFENYGFFRSRFSGDEQNYILQLGEKDIREDVPNLGILEDAEQNTKEVFTALLTQMGFENINVNFGEVQ